MGIQSQFRTVTQHELYGISESFGNWKQLCRNIGSLETLEKTSALSQVIVRLVERLMLRGMYHIYQHAQSEDIARRSVTTR